MLVRVNTHTFVKHAKVSLFIGPGPSVSFIVGHYCHCGVANFFTYTYDENPVISDKNLNPYKKPIENSKEFI